MGKDRFSGAMRFGDDSCGYIHGHRQHPVWGNSAAEDLDSVSALLDLLTNAFDRLCCRFDLRRRNVVLFDKPLHVNRSAAFGIERISDSENARSTHLSVRYSPPDVIGVVQDRRRAEPGCKTPAREHLFELRGEIAGRTFVGMK